MAQALLRSIMATATAPSQPTAPRDQPGWRLGEALLPSLAYVHPLTGDHQGGTSVSIFGAGFAFNGTNPENMVRPPLSRRA